MNSSVDCFEQLFSFSESESHADVDEDRAYAPIVLMDGGLSTHLEDKLHRDISSSLWSAALLDKDPEAILRTHRDFSEAGADLILTSTYQTSLPGFRNAGYSEDRAVELMRRGVALAVQARDDYFARLNVGLQGGSPRISAVKPLVGLSLGPFGATLGNGAEYTGAYGHSDGGRVDRASVDFLSSFHFSRLVSFASDLRTWSSIDFTAFETNPLLTEGLAIRRALRLLRAWCWDRYGEDGEDAEGNEKGRRQRRKWCWWMKPAYISYVFPDGVIPETRRDGGKPHEDTSVYKVLKETLYGTVGEEDPTGTGQPGSDSKDGEAPLIVGIGINCTKPHYLLPLVLEMTTALSSEQLRSAAHSSLRPYLFLAPDGGLIWDGRARQWRSAAVARSDPSRNEDSEKDDKTAWASQVLEAAAVARRPHVEGGESPWAGVFVGGCCKTSTEEVHRLRQLLGRGRGRGRAVGRLG